MSALEKAARAAEETMTAYLTDGRKFDAEFMARAIARAVLIAVREPDGRTCNAAYGVTGIGNRFTAMIDAILRDHPLKGSGETSLRSVPTEQDHKPAPQVEP